MKTGLNDIEMKIQITALLESIRKYYHYFLLRYGLWNHASNAVSVYDVINVVQECFDINVITFVSRYFWCVLGKQLRQQMGVSSILICM